MCWKLMMTTTMIESKVVWDLRQALLIIKNADPCKHEYHIDIIRKCAALCDAECPLPSSCETIPVPCGACRARNAILSVLESDDEQS